MKTFKLGQAVNCPPDRGEAGYSGKITYIGELIHVNIHGISYQWITVERKAVGYSHNSRHVWPSHRLG